MAASPSPRTAPPISVGCDIGGSSIKIVRLRRLRISESSEIPSLRAISAGSLVRELGDELATLAGDDAEHCGVAVPGFLDARRRRIVHLSNLPQLDGVDLAGRLERRLGLPVRLDADTNAGGVAESRIGAARGVDRVLYVSLGTGLGVSLVVDGEPMRASHHVVGHVARLNLQVDDDSLSGRDREAERLLCAAGVLRRYRRAGGPKSVRTAKSLFERGLEGDPLAAAAFDSHGADLAALLRLLIPLWRPRACVIGGGLAGAAELFLPRTRSVLRREMPPDLRDRVDLRVSALGRFAGAVGAAMLARPE